MSIAMRPLRPSLGAEVTNIALASLGDKEMGDVLTAWRRDAFDGADRRLLYRTQIRSIDRHWQN